MKTALLLVLIAPFVLLASSTSAATVGEYMSTVHAEAQPDVSAALSQISTTTVFSIPIVSMVDSAGTFFRAAFANTARFVSLLRDGSHYEVVGISIAEK